MMKNIRFINFKGMTFLLLILVLAIGCERELSDNATVATFSTTGEIFTDGPVGLGEDFYFPFGGSKFDAASFDGEGFESLVSIRIDVPNADDPTGNYAGAILRVDGAGRDLRGYDALTFYAKASQGVVLGEVGYGTDFLEDKYRVAVQNLSLGTNWAKYTIPIPDALKLVEERGLFWYSLGTQNTGGLGYTVWFDDIKFEKLGNIAQPRPKILNGEDQFLETFNESVFPIGGLTQTFNLANGLDQVVLASPAYFTFSSSNTSVATVNEQGEVTVVGASLPDPVTGELIPAVITATMNELEAEGSLTLASFGAFELAPVPDEAPENVISLFSDSYEDVPVDYYNGFFNGDGQTTQGGAPPINVGGGEVINYTNLNFVGIGTFLNVQPIDATQMTHLHVDINVQEPVTSGDFIRLQILNGVQTTNELSGSFTIFDTDLVTNGWASYDIPLGDFAGLSAKDALGLLFFISDTTVSNIYVDNIYYYREVLEASPNVDDSAATEVALPIGFESTSLTYDFGGFEGAESEIIANPDATGINPTGNVMRTIKTEGAQFFAGTFLNLDAPIDMSSSKKFRMKIWSPKAGIPIKVRLENADNSIGIEVDVTTTTTNQWEELEWDFTGQNNAAAFVKIVVFFEFIDGVPGDGSTYYFDDLQIID
ncbi:carbohydrate-binding protein [Patiriisocius sp. Uisw_017]|jgi:hypothetical protein|uniref:carbohydrate-binding protein n=1 Tax=Patiriisocius sp. Uisw_017 TaxID=3230968 RepID=UPI0039E97739